MDRSAPADASLVMMFADGLAWCDVTCRRGELIVWPEWADKPLDPMESARTKPLLAMMGAQVGGDRRGARSVERADDGLRALLASAGLDLAEVAS